MAYARAPLVTISQRRLLVFVAHLGLAALANWAAFLLRFDRELPASEWDLFISVLPLLLGLRALTFYPFRLYDGVWRYTGFWDLRDLALSVLFGTVLFFVTVRFGLGLRAYPSSIFVIDALLLFCFLAGLRAWPRLVEACGRRPTTQKRVLIVGAGDAGAMIVREMRNRPEYGYRPVGFIDDDPKKLGHRIHGVPVLGARTALPRLVIQHGPEALLVAMPSVAPTVIRSIVQALQPFDIPIKTLPHLRELLQCSVQVDQIRDLSIEDLLDRAPISLDPAPLRRLMQGARVLVTGAGGSIGSELCRQIAALNPDSLILLDRYENGLFAVAHELQAYPSLNCTTVVADITDVGQINRLFAEHRPMLVFHAAAHKHVPLMEGNLCEAVRNNVGGTRIVAEAAHRHRAERFILISTDKAVNPVSVMGATKAVAERVVQHLAQSSETIFAGVRFGNVLGSNGSVVPLLLGQIARGGPVTITDPGMQRYFMLIGEAVQLVLHAACLARGGELFVLDMGARINLDEMARNLIRLAGLVPGKDIPIAYVGRRPGEKLVEELLAAHERAEATAVPKVSAVRRVLRTQDPDVLSPVARLEQAAAEGHVAKVLALLTDLIPTYRPSDDVAAPSSIIPDVVSDESTGLPLAIAADPLASEPPRLG